MPRKVFTAGEVLTAADVNTFLSDQTVMTFAGTAARSSAIPTPVEGMVSYLADSDSFQAWTGASWVSLTDSAIQKSLIDAAGDLIIGTADNTPARLAIGGSGTFLKSNGTTATWEAVPTGGKTLLSTTNLSGTSTTVSSISQGYKDLEIHLGPQITLNASAALRFAVTGSTATPELVYASGTTLNTFPSFTGSSTSGGIFSNITIYIPNYTSADRKTVQTYGRWSGSFIGGGLMTSSDTPMDSFTLTTVAGTATFTDGQIKIYGVN
jgi:hypothetical protein